MERERQDRLPVRVEHWATSSPEEAGEVLTALYGRSSFGAPQDGHAFQVSMARHRAGRLAVAAFDVGAPVNTTTVDYPPGVFGFVRSGSLEIRHQPDAQRVGAGESFSYLRERTSYVVRSFRVDVLSLPPGTCERVAAEQGHACAPLVGSLPVDAAAARRWRTAGDYAERLLRDPAAPLAAPLLNTAVADLLAATALTTFPNATMSPHYLPGPGRVAGRAVRRAVAYIDEHAHEPITLTDVAAAAGTGPRALQYAFRRHHDVTPMGYLRRVRLARAHAELAAAEPGAGTTVGTVAVRWGWGKPGSFAAAYRSVYGVPPAQTLHEPGR